MAYCVQMGTFCFYVNSDDGSCDCLSDCPVAFGGNECDFDEYEMEDELNG